ncbi:hypothetical protein [Bradyrhizobium sp. UFLA05-112]
MSPRRQNQPLMAPHARFDPEAELFELLADLECETAFARLDANRNCRCGTQGRGDLRKGAFKFVDRFLDGDETDGACRLAQAKRRRESNPDKAAPPQGEIQAGTALARDDRTMEVGKMRKRDRGLDDLIVLGGN